MNDEILDWQRYGLCREVDAEMFFPDRRDASCVQEAKATCGLCVVKDICRDYALRHPKLEGIWGGLDEFERFDLREGVVVELEVSEGTCTGCTEDMRPRYSVYDGRPEHRGGGFCVICYGRVELEIDLTVLTEVGAPALLVA